MRRSVDDVNHNLIPKRTTLVGLAHGLATQEDAGC